MPTIKYFRNTINRGLSSVFVSSASSLQINVSNNFSSLINISSNLYTVPSGKIAKVLLNLRNLYVAEAYFGFKQANASYNNSSVSNSFKNIVSNQISGHFKIGEKFYKFQNSFSTNSSFNKELNPFNTTSSAINLNTITANSLYSLLNIGPNIFAFDSFAFGSGGPLSSSLGPFVSQFQTTDSISRLLGHAAAGNRTVPGLASAETRENNIFLKEGDNLNVSVAGNLIHSHSYSAVVGGIFSTAANTPGVYYIVNQISISYDFVVLEEDI